MMEKQNTVKKTSSITGIALHTGGRAHLSIRPAPPDTGIEFLRTDLPGSQKVKAHVSNVTDVQRGTTLTYLNTKVYTVEHVLSALHAASVDNALIEMDGPEPPIVDGSSKPYLDMILDSGIAEQDSPAPIIRIEELFSVEDNETKIYAFPCDCLRITCIVSYGATDLDSQYFSSDIDIGGFQREIAPARTFCIYGELEKLISYGLVKGGSLDNAIVMHDGAIICKDEMRYKNELARHKVLDIIGDLYLAGSRIRGHIIAIKPGHPSNVALVQKIVSKYDCDKRLAV